MTGSRGRIGAVVAFALLASCRAVPPAVQPVPPPPVIAPVSTPAPVPQASLPWDIAPVSRGDWSYRQDGANSLAQFGERGLEARLVIACLAATRQISLTLAMVAGPPRTITIRTSSGTLQWPAAAAPAGTAALTATRAARDSGLDWMAYSRGRIGIELDGATHLVAPVGGEIGRVVEDCRN